MNLLEHFVEVSEYLGIFLNQFLELENDERELPLVNVPRWRTNTILDEVREQVVLIRPDDGGILGKPSSNGKVVCNIQRHVYSIVIANSHAETKLIRQETCNEAKSEC